MEEFYYITIATKPHPILENIKKRVNDNGEQIFVLGTQENRSIGWHANANFGVKLREVQNFVMQKSLNDNDIILFTDAYDVIYTGDKETILERFKKFEKPLIFGCETECNPDPDMNVHYLKKNVRFPYLNSGMFIGRVWAIRKCMENYLYDDTNDDQRFWTKQFLTHTNLIELDYENQLFLNTHGIDIEDISWNRKDAFYNGINPQYVHVNGPVKADLNRFL